MKTTARRITTTVTMTVLILTTVLTGAAQAVPDPSPTAPPAVEDKVDQLLGLLLWFGGAAVLAGLIIAGIAMALGKDRGHGGREGMDKLWYVAAGALIIGSASTLAGWLLG